MIWAIFGVLHSLFRAAFAETNRLFQVDSRQLNFWHAAFGMIFLLPFLPFIEWNYPPSLYGSAVIISLVVTSGSLMQLTMAERQTARVSNMHVPLEALTAFFIWGFLVPDAGEMFLKDPQATSLTGLAFVLMTVGLIRIRVNDMGLKSFMIVVSGALAFGASGVLIKVLITQDILPGAVFTFVFVNYAVMTLVMGIVLLIKKKADTGLFKTNVMQAGVLAGIFSAASYICLIYSLVYVANPAYSIMLTMLVPVWLLAYHRLKKVEDTASPGFSAVIVLGAVLLIAANM